MKRLLTLILFFTLIGTAGKAQVQRVIGDSLALGVKPNAKINLDGKIYLKRVDTGTGTDSILVIKNGVVKKVVPVDISGKANLVGENTFIGDQEIIGILDVDDINVTGGLSVSGYSDFRGSINVYGRINAKSGIDAQSEKIENLATATAATDAANKSYVDNGLANKENLSNKVTDLSSASNTTYPTSLAVANAIASVASGVQYQGLWDASTNTPALPTAAPANNGWFYIVNASGSYGGESYVVGDWVMSDGSAWGKVPMSGLVANKADVDGSNATGTWGINISGSANGLGSYTWNPTVKNTSDYLFGRSGADEVAIISPTGVAAMLTGQTLNNNINGNASSATTWGGGSANFLIAPTGNIQGVIGYSPFDGGYREFGVSPLRTFLGLGSAAYQPTTAFQSALGYTPYNPASYPVNAGGETLQSVTDRGSSTGTLITTEGLVSNDDVSINGLLEVTQPITTYSTTPGKYVSVSGDDIIFKDSAPYILKLQKEATALTENHTQYFQNKTGHIALLSDLPNKNYFGTYTFQFNITAAANDSFGSFNVSIPGADYGDVVSVSIYNSSSHVLENIHMTGLVESPDTATVYIRNLGASSLTIPVDSMLKVAIIR